MEHVKIYCDKPADRDALVQILARNDYTVRIAREKKGTNNRYIYYVEFWREK